jgi:hypothetical protein
MRRAAELYRTTTIMIIIIIIIIIISCRFKAARLLRSWSRIPSGARMSVFCECCVLSGRCLCDELITRPEESYRLWFAGCCPQTGHTTLNSTLYRQLENQASNTTDSNHFYNTLELLMMGIKLPETCWASSKICNKNHMLHLVGILFPHNIDDARSKPHQT